MANILNLVNTNFINSSGVILFSNFFDYIQNNLDFRNASSSIFDGLCGSSGCSGDQANFNLGNDAFIRNLLSISARSGGNSIVGGATSTIQTGDAYAGLNLINVANTNFVDSEYLLVTLNAFQGVNGDIVFPSLSNFFNSLRGSSGSVAISNDAEVDNSANVDSSTGGNSVDGNGSIATGDSHSSSNVFNQINTNLVGGANVSILFRVYGKWVGDVFGAPDNLKWTQGSNGSIYLFDTGSATTGGAASSSQANFNGSNKAVIDNDVSVIALTGNNAITGAGTGLISTGNAFAGANIVNIANSNIVGRNWIMAIINIFGDWNGNIAFGRPDLWVGEQIGAPQEVHQNDVLNYKLTVINNGDSPATIVKLYDDNISENLSIINSSIAYARDEHGRLVWDIGNLPAGKAIEINYQAKVLKDIEADITNTITVIARETDNNVADNSDTASVRIKAKSIARPGGHRRSSSGGSSGKAIAKGQVLGTSTSNSIITALRSDPLSMLKDRKLPVHQKLVVSNPSDATAKSVLLRDTLRSPQGKIIHTEVWNFGDVKPHEEITVTYDVQFNDSAAKGFYNLSTTIESDNGKTVGTGINGLILLGEFAAPPATYAKKGANPKATTTISVSKKNTDRKEEVAEIVQAQDIPIAPIPAYQMPKPTIKGNILNYFSLVPAVLSKVFQSITKAK
jgi:uncharacterized repeat protein (TIGR01451 family)